MLVKKALPPFPFNVLLRYFAHVSPINFLHLSNLLTIFEQRNHARHMSLPLEIFAGRVEVGAQPGVAGCDMWRGLE